MSVTEQVVVTRNGQLFIPLRSIQTKKMFNPREHLDREQLTLLAASMKAIGQLEAIWLQKGSNELIEGKHRLKVAEQLGWRDIRFEYIDCDDQKARELAVIANSFGHRLNALEIARNVDQILQNTEGSVDQKRQDLAMQLGIGDRTLQMYLQIYRGLAVDVRSIATRLLREKLVPLDTIGQISELHPDIKQKAILTEKLAKGDTVTVNRMIDAHLAGQRVAVEQEREDSARAVAATSVSASEGKTPDKAEKKKFRYFTTSKIKVQKVTVKDVKHGIWFPDKSGKLVNLNDLYEDFVKHVQVGDLLTVNVRAEQYTEAKPKKKS